jgi:BlaI family penicillinase repressor
MEIVYRIGQVTAADVQEELEDAPSYSAVRALMRILESKGHLHHVRIGRRYCYEAVVPREKARRSALRGLLHNFFGGSQSKLVATLLDDGEDCPSEQELEVIAEIIRRSRDKGR